MPAGLRTLCSELRARRAALLSRRGPDSRESPTNGRSTEESGETMKTRVLGKSGLEVSALGLGCMGMSEFYGESDERESPATLHHALDHGVTFWDTADMYGSGANEFLLSQVLAERRNEVVLATKFGIVRGEDGSFDGISGDPDYVRAACDASLERLDVEHIDLYYQHRVDPRVPIEDTVGAMAELVEAGKVRHIGLSEAASETLRRAAAVHPITALQTEYSLWSRDVEADILPACRELGIGLVAYSPLGRGFLTGRFRSPEDLPEDDWRRTNPRFQGESFDANLRLADRVQETAQAKGCTPAQLALAWLLARGDDVVPIPGTRKVERLDENAAAVELELDEAELQSLADSMPPVLGERYAEAAMVFVDR